MLGGGRLFHVNVNCADLARSRQFYVEGIGLVEGVRTTPGAVQDGSAFGLESAQWDAWILLGRRGYEGGAIDLLQWQAPAPLGAPPSAPNDNGFQRLGFGVPDLDAAMRSLTHSGGTVWGEPTVHRSDVAGEVRVVHASDPDGVAVELFEGRGPELTFVSVVCSDLERSLAWYAALGFEEIARFSSSGADGAHLRLDGAYAFHEIMLAPPGGGRVSVLLVGFDAPPARSAPLRPANALGIWRAAFLVPDVDGAHAEFASAGIAAISTPVEMAMGPGLPGLRFVCFRGPDGEVLELIETPR